MAGIHAFFFFFFFNDTATTEIYTLSLHDALPIFLLLGRRCGHLLLLFVTADPRLTTMYTAALASVKETKTCPETCPWRARTSPKPPYASQHEKEKPLGKSATYRGAGLHGEDCKGPPLPAELS